MSTPLQLLDLKPEQQDGQAEIIAGLARRQKEISPKYFYDETGARLFEEICQQPEYYPTRTEIGIMQSRMAQIASLIGPRASIIEFGSGAGVKTRLLLEGIPEIAAYVPVDISREQLIASSDQIARDFPDIEVLPICADFMQPFELPNPHIAPDRNIVYFPGSTIGNFSTAQSVRLLRTMRTQARVNGALLIGVDLIKAPDIVERAYNDAAGVTAQFNLNLLAHLNHAYDANFKLQAFEHAAIYDEKDCRVEMRLISLCRQNVRVAGANFELEKGEYIVTEHSHKYSIDSFESLARQAGFSPNEIWTDPDRLFSVHFLTAA